MKIILEKEEYIKLRPEALKDTLINEIKEVIANMGGRSEWHIEAAFNSIEERIRNFDRQIERQENDPNLLWGVVESAPQD